MRRISDEELRNYINSKIKNLEDNQDTKNVFPIVDLILEVVVPIIRYIRENE